MHPAQHRLRAHLALLAVSLGLVASACTPDIGDKCNLSTDCSLRGERLCDTSQPGGYCTILNCRGNLCPVDAACVLFAPTVPGCGYDDRSVARTAHAFCVAQCKSDSDCRDGYVCADPRGVPWRAIILDDDQRQHICIARPDTTEPLGSGLQGLDAGPPVCRASSPDGGPIVLTDAGPRLGDAALDAPSSAPPQDGGVDAAETDAAGPDASDAGDGGITDASNPG